MKRNGGPVFPASVNPGDPNGPFEAWQFDPCLVQATDPTKHSAGSETTMSPRLIGPGLFIAGAGCAAHQRQRDR
jgi:hypothetical protein